MDRFEMDRKALVIGIDDYEREGDRLKCCVNDANEMAKLLQSNGDAAKSRNCDVVLLTTAQGSVGNARLQRAIIDFFKSSNQMQTAVLYFAGHGVIHSGTEAGYLMSTDGRDHAWGMELAHMIKLANEAHRTIASTVIILDCCHSGQAGGASRSEQGQVAQIGPGVTILTSCNADQKAREEGKHGTFTKLLLDALGGSAADIRGNITPASVYTHIDQILGAHEQRPLYKANVQRFVTLRQVEPRIPPNVLDRLPQYFPDPDEDIRLTPQHEPDRKNIPPKFRKLPQDFVKEAAFADLQAYNRQGLVEPFGASKPHMYYAAIESKWCRLTSLGKHYRNLAENKHSIKTSPRE